MELEEMKSLWATMGKRLEKQEKLTDELILQMTQQKSKNHLSRIVYAETVGVILTITALIYFIFNFHLLNTDFQKYCGIGVILLLALGIGLGLTVIQKVKKINLAKNSYYQTLQAFGQFRRFLGFYKRISIALNIASPILLIPVCYAVFLEKDIMEDIMVLKSGLFIGLLIGAVLGAGFFYIIVKFYRKNVSEAKRALEEYK